MTVIRVRDHESFDSAMRRFKRAVDKSGVSAELRRRQFFEPPSERRKRARAAAIKRFRKRQQRDNSIGMPRTH